MLSRKIRYFYVTVVISLLFMGFIVYVYPTTYRTLDLRIFPLKWQTIRSLVSDNRHEPGFNIDSCTRARNVTKSLAIPPHYPRNGTGTVVTTSFKNAVVNTICHENPSLKAIVPVYSAFGNYERRSAIRNTTGKLCEQYMCKLVFIVGFSRNGTLSPKLKDEYDRYGDILLVKRVDTYRDLNDKAVAMLDWLIEFCSEPEYVIHFVDDTFVNIKLFLEDLQQLSDAVYGCIGRGFTPWRGVGTKYYVSKYEYPYEIYPDFVVGVAYAFPNSLSKTLRCSVHDAIYVWLEDVWLMGHVREQAGVKAVHTNRKEQRFGPVNMKDVDKYLYIHSVEVHDFYRLYEMLNSKNISAVNV